MTDKNKVLPIVVGETVRGYYTALAQRDADWERVKPLIELLESGIYSKEGWVREVHRALAQLEGKP